MKVTEPSAASATVPCVAACTEVMVNLSPSGSVSLESSEVDASFTDWPAVTEVVSLTASGPSLTPVMWIVPVAGLPS